MFGIPFQGAQHRRRESGPSRTSKGKRWIEVSFCRLVHVSASAPSAPPADVPHARVRLPGRRRSPRPRTAWWPTDRARSGPLPLRLFAPILEPDESRHEVEMGAAILAGDHRTAWEGTRTGS